MFETLRLDSSDPHHLVGELKLEGARGRPRQIRNLLRQRPLLLQLAEHKRTYDEVRPMIPRVVAALSSFRFLDLNPDKMRLASPPGLTVLGDEGENLSSVLQAIHQDPAQRQSLISWIRELTPMDASDFDFPADPAGKVLVSLVEENGQRTSAYSASDGTLRFLAMIAALLGPQPARFCFFEELDNGIHPTRLHLLLQLIEHKVGEGSLQIVTTTLSPQLLAMLSPRALENASLTSRLPGCVETRIIRILDIPDARKIIQQQELAHLHASGWLEDAVFFTQEPQA